MHLLAIFLLAAPAPADSYPTAKGTAGVSFYLPTGTDPRLVGVTYFLANDMAARADFGLAAPLSPSGPGIFATFSASLGLRLYQLKRERVGVFLQPAVAIGRESSPAVAANAAEFIRFAGGIGVEYFFTNRFSAGAILEIALKLANLAGPAGTSVFTTFGTDTSWLSANIYF